MTTCNPTYNLFRAAVIETVNEEWFINGQSRRHKTKYTSYSKEKLETLPSDRLIEIILTLQIERDTLLYSRDDRHRSQTHPVTKLPAPRMTGRERNGLDYDKIEKQRAEIRAIKERRKMENELKQRNAHRTDAIFVNPHEKTSRNSGKLKPIERNPTDYQKIENKRAEIKKLKEKMKSEKMDLKQRHVHRTDNLFTNPYEEVVHVRALKHDEKRNSKKKKGKLLEHDVREKIVSPITPDSINPVSVNRKATD